jgi:hypothetical protein
MDASDDDSDRHSYECDRCHGVFDSRQDGEPWVEPPGHDSPDGLPTYWCPKCLAKVEALWETEREQEAELERQRLDARSRDYASEWTETEG